MRKISCILLTLLIVFVCSLSYAAVGIKVNAIGVGAAADLDFAQGAAQTTDGSTYPVGNSISAELPTDKTAIPLTYAVVPITITSRSVTLGMGQPGQLINLVGVHNSTSATLTITNTGPHSGWTSATMNTNGYTLTLLYVNDDFGWVVVRYYGTSVS